MKHYLLLCFHTSKIQLKWHKHQKPQSPVRNSCFFEEKEEITNNFALLKIDLFIRVTPCWPSVSAETFPFYTKVFGYLVSPKRIKFTDPNYISETTSNKKGLKHTGVSVKQNNESNIFLQRGGFSLGKSEIRSQLNQLGWVATEVQAQLLLNSERRISDFVTWVDKSILYVSIRLV